MGVFKKGKSSIMAKFQRTDLVIGRGRTAKRSREVLS